jgi:septum formation protein
MQRPRERIGSRTPIVLASGSAARRSLLAAAGVAVKLEPHGVDERAVEKSLTEPTPRRVAAALAAAKAVEVSRRLPNALVIGADQTLDLGGATLSKAVDRAAAARQLHALSAKTHALHSAFAIASEGAIVARGAKSARLTMRTLGKPEIEAYLDAVGDTAIASVGSYQLEGLGIRLFDRIDGDYFTILGLPMLPLLAALRQLGALTP